MDEEQKVLSLAKAEDGANKEPASNIDEPRSEETMKRANEEPASSIDEPGSEETDNEHVIEEIHDGLHFDPPRLSISAPEAKFRRLRRASVGPQLEMPVLKFPSAQMVLIAMAFFGFLNVYSLRVDMSVSIVAMTNSTALAAGHENQSSACGHLSGSKKQEDGSFVWNTIEQGVILSAFYYGYIVTNIFGGTLAQVVGGKRMLLCGILFTSIMTLITPICVEKGGLPVMIILRILCGLFEGVSYPSMHVIISRWAAPSQRSKMATAVYAGAQMGAVVTMPLAGALCAVNNSGWHYVFYFFGGLGCAWAMLWCFLVFDSPDKHPRIEEAELKYIETSLAGQGGKRVLKVPWKAIATSLPVYALAFAHFCSNWGYFLLISALPTFMKTILGFDIKENGFLSGVPYLISWICMIGAGYSCDALRTSGLMSTTGVRKLSIAIGFLIPAVCLVATGLAGCNRAAAVTLITLAIGINGVAMAGYGVNHLDLAPSYAGTLMGITNSFATVPAMSCMSIVGVITYKNQTVEAWRFIFYLTASLNVAGTIVYGIFGSGKRQPWANPPARKSLLPNEIVSNQ